MSTLGAVTSPSTFGRSADRPFDGDCGQTNSCIDIVAEGGIDCNNSVHVFM